MVDIKAVLAEYDIDEGDFGFTSMSEDEYNEAVNVKEETIEEYKQRLLAVEKLILPFLTALLKTADNPIIKWPNRGPKIKDQIEKIVKLTRS